MHTMPRIAAYLQSAPTCNIVVGDAVNISCSLWDRHAGVQQVPQCAERPIRLRAHLSKLGDMVCHNPVGLQEEVRCRCNVHLFAQRPESYTWPCTALGMPHGTGGKHCWQPHIIPITFSLMIGIIRQAAYRSKLNDAIMLCVKARRLEVEGHERPRQL